MLQTTMGAIGMITDKMIEVAKAMVTSAKENEGKTWTESVLDLVVFGPVKVIGWIWGSEEPDAEEGKMLIDERDGDILMRGRPPGCPSSLKEAKKQMENMTDLEKRMIGFENVPMPPLQVNEEEEWKETSDPVGSIFRNELQVDLENRKLIGTVFKNEEEYQESSKNFIDTFYPETSEEDE